MRYARAFGVCLVAACVALGAFVASASAAPPEYGRCVKLAKVGKVYTGNFIDKGCTKEATAKEKEEGKKNKYNWLPGGVKLGQTSTGGKATLQEVGKYAVGCNSESSVGEYVGTKEAKGLFVKFEGCHVPPYICTSAGHPEGELETKELEGRAVWLNKAKHEAGLDLFPAKGEEKFIAFNCGALHVEVRGSILVPVQANKMSTTFKLKYKQKNGFQETKFYENEEGKLVEDVLEANFAEKGWAKAGQSITSTVKNEEALELNTYV
jgi:hypothetical protein